MGVLAHASIPLFTEETGPAPGVLAGRGGMNGLFEVRALKVFLWDIYNSLSLSQHSVIPPYRGTQSGRQRTDRYMESSNPV